MNTTVLEKLKTQKIEVAVVSYGGCGSNTLAEYLHGNRVRVYGPVWDGQVCHYPEPLGFNGFTKFIYIYRDPRDAFYSQFIRGEGYWDVNQYKLSGYTIDDDNQLSSDLLFRLMVQQFRKWTKTKMDHVMIMKYEELFDDALNDKLSQFIGKPIHGSIEYKPNNHPKLPKELLEGLFDRYANDIEFINTFKE